MKRVKIASMAFVLLLSLSYCNQPKSEEAPAQPQKENTMNLEVSNVDFQSAYDQANGKINILDVRTQPEYTGGHVPGAVFLSLQEIQALGPAAADKIPFSRDEPLYVICATGNRSYYAAQMLRQIGYGDATSVQAGTMGWMRSGKPLER